MPRGTESWDKVLLNQCLMCVEQHGTNFGEFGGGTKRIKGRTSGTENQHGYVSMMMQ